MLFVSILFFAFYFRTRYFRSVIAAFQIKQRDNVLPSLKNDRKYDINVYNIWSNFKIRFKLGPYQFHTMVYENKGFTITFVKYKFSCRFFFQKAQHLNCL